MAAIQYKASENLMKSPHFPSEWSAHIATWTAWPASPEEWPLGLDLVRSEVASLVNLVASSEKVHVLASGPDAYQSAINAVGDVANVVKINYGDIWLRDTGPIYCRLSGSEEKEAQLFRFNGWGGKYNLPFDSAVSLEIAKKSGTKYRQHDFILEGGSIDTDGDGTALTTRQCLLNTNRNSHWTQEQAELSLAEALGIKKLIWLDDGLINDHTDGHVDNIARFVGKGKVVCQRPSGENDPNAETYRNIEMKLRRSHCANGELLEVITIPSPGRVEGTNKNIMPASHMNFYIGNNVVAVPVYNDIGNKAVAELSKIFTTRKVVGLSSRALLEGGGSFHCITQQEPQ